MTVVSFLIISLIMSVVYYFNFVPTLIFASIVGVAFLFWIGSVVSKANAKAEAEAEAKYQIDKKELDTNIKNANQHIKNTFVDSDNIRNYGNVIWREPNVNLYSFKTVTTYTSVRGGYSKSGKSTTRNGVNSGRGKTSVGGTKGRREQVDEKENLGIHNVYVTTTGVKICGESDYSLSYDQISSFRRSDNTTIQINVDKMKFPLNLSFGDWRRCELVYAAMKSVS